jgi:hypothetical protein
MRCGQELARTELFCRQCGSGQPAAREALDEEPPEHSPDSAAPRPLSGVSFGSPLSRRVAAVGTLGALVMALGTFLDLAPAWPAYGLPHVTGVESTEGSFTLLFAVASGGMILLWGTGLAEGRGPLLAALVLSILAILAMASVSSNVLHATRLLVRTDVSLATALGRGVWVSGAGALIVAATSVYALLAARRRRLDPPARPEL